MAHNDDNGGDGKEQKEGEEHDLVGVDEVLKNSRTLSTKSSSSSELSTGFNDVLDSDWN